MQPKDGGTYSGHSSCDAKLSKTDCGTIELKKLNGYLTAGIINKVYYLLRKISTHDRVIKKLNQLMTLTNVLLIDKQIVLKAMNSKFKNFEDAMQNYACESYGNIDLILTRNTKDYRKSEISVMTPEQYYKMKIGT